MIDITSMATSPQLAEFSNVFRTRTGDRHACEPLISYLQNSGYSKFGVISKDISYALDCTERLVERGSSAGLNYGEYSCATHDRDMHEHIQALNPTCVAAVFISSQDEIGYFRILTPVRKAMGDIPVLGSAMPGSRKFRAMPGNLADGIV